MGRTILNIGLCILLLPSLGLANAVGPEFFRGKAKEVRIPLGQSVILMAENNEKIKVASLLWNTATAKAEIVKDNPSVVRVTGLKPGETVLRIFGGEALPDTIIIHVFDPKLPANRGGSVPLTISYVADKNGKAERGKLMIPRKLMLAAAGSEREPVAQASAGRNLFTGLAFSAALVTGGLWFVRRSGKSARGILVLFIVSSVVGFTAFVPQLFGNAGPPELKKLEESLKKFEVDAKNATAKLDIDVVLVPDGDRMELVLPIALAPPEVKR